MGESFSLGSLGRVSQSGLLHMGVSCGVGICCVVGTVCTQRVREGGAKTGRAFKVEARARARCVYPARRTCTASTTVVYDDSWVERLGGGGFCF